MNIHREIFIQAKTTFNHHKDIGLLKSYLFLMRLNINTILKVWKGNKKDNFLDSYLILTNKMLLDIESALVLVRKGSYGPAWTLCASLYRTMRMLIALHADSSLCADFLDEDFDTYQINKDFFSKFKEGALLKLINDELGSGSGERSEMEKLLHGSGFAARKYYCNRVIDEDGLRSPVLRFSFFYEKDKAEGILKILQGFVLDNVGLFLEEYQSRPEYKQFTRVRQFYFMFIDKAGIKHATPVKN